MVTYPELAAGLDERVVPTVGLVPRREGHRLEAGPEAEPRVDRQARACGEDRFQVELDPFGGVTAAAVVLGERRPQLEIHRDREVLVHPEPELDDHRKLAREPGAERVARHD